MKRYDSYKDSRSAWIGEIPSHWEVNRMRYIINYEKGKNPKELAFEEEEGMLPYLSMDYLRANFDFTQYSYPSDNSVICKENDIVLLWDGANAGEFLKAKNGLLCSTCALISPKNVDKQYFWFLSKSLQDYLKDMTNGMGVPHVDSEELKNLDVIIPPVSEQKAIVDYLDKKCASIEGIIATQERRIALLNELKQSVITEAVTHGINPDTQLRDSGIDWIGQIPKHWEIKPFKFNMRICNGADYKHVEVEENEGYPVLGSGGVFAYASDYMFDGEALLLGRKGTIDKPLYFKGKFWTVDTMFYAIPDKNVCCKYMYYQSLGFPFDRYSTSTALPSMASRDLKNNPICFPPLEEQIQIVDYIENKISPIDSAITKAKREIELLREYKQSVITEAVTGKIKVC